MTPVLVALAVAAALVLLAAPRVDAASTPGVCQFFTTCADCACNTFDYDVGESCDTGCAWVPGTGACVDAADAPTGAYTSLWAGGADLDDASVRSQWVEAGRTTCTVGHEVGPIISVCWCHQPGGRWPPSGCG